MKKIFKITALIMVLFSVINISAFANAGPGYLSAVNKGGVYIELDDCPIEVEKEILTFDVNTPPDPFLSAKEIVKNYNDKFTAEYTFYNPTEYDITAKVYFPLDCGASYTRDFVKGTGIIDYLDFDKYSVKLDGKDISATVRNTYSGYTSDMNKFIEDMSNDFTPTEDFIITKHIYTHENFNYGKDTYYFAYFDWTRESAEDPAIGVKGETALTQKGENSVSFWARILENENVVVYVFGESDVIPQPWGYNDRDKDGTVKYLETVKITADEYLRECGWSEETGISLKDRYMLLYQYNEYLKGNDVSDGVVYSYLDFEELMHYGVMKWFEYDITIPAGGRVINTVSAPFYPTVYYQENPYRYQYLYYMSPAKGWADFKNIEIYINTPFEIAENSVDGFEKTENGYYYKGDGLPDGELEFSLYTGIKMPKRPNPYVKMFAGPLVLIIMLAALYIWVIYDKIKKYEEKNGKFKG